MDEPIQETTVVWRRVTSQALAGNPLGDPVTRRLPVLLPPGYDPSGTRRYPALYGLAGFTGRGAGMLNDSAWEPTLRDRLDQLYAAGMPHVIVVLPDCFTRFGGSQYLNSSATGNYEDYLTQELVPFIDQHYATIAGPQGRGLFGISSGGFGALTLAMRRPDLFGAIACHSGDMAFDLCYLPDFPKAATALALAGGLTTWWQAFEAKRKKDGSDFTILNVVAMAACYSPNPNAPLGLDLPFELETCLLDQDTWARWVAWDPITMVMTGRNADALRQLQLLYIECGVRDEYHLHFGARRFVQRLRAHGIIHEYAEFDDGHRSLQYRYDISLPKLATALNQGLGPGVRVDPIPSR